MFNNCVYYKFTIEFWPSSNPFTVAECMFSLSAVLVKRVFCFVLEFCSVTRRWIMHSFPFFFFRHKLNTWMLCRAGVPAWLCCSSSCCSHRREKKCWVKFFLRRQKIAISHRSALRASQVGCGLIWNLRGGAEWPGVWSEQGSNYVSQLRAGFSGGALTKLSGFQFDSDVLNLDDEQDAPPWMWRQFLCHLINLLA